MKNEKYNPGFLLKSGHFNTIYPTLFRRQKAPEYKRTRLTTFDGDFLDIDFLKTGSKKIAILCHGLEGSSQSKYIIGTGDILMNAGWDVAAMNYRFCSGEVNNKLRMYHSGATEDLQVVINALYDEYEEICLVGFSLGGNLCLKYCGENGNQISSKISRVVAVSVPVDLKAGSINIGKPSNFIYENKFLDSLVEKLHVKHKKYGDEIDISKLNEVKKLYDFDDLFTGPIHGFKDAEDYYRQCSSKQFINDIKIPALIINAEDDPFLPEECYPFKEAEQNKNVSLVVPKYGGHVGFAFYNEKYYWIERKIKSWLEK
ncbi:MAG: alpha/beta fold hydrolase [Saprospiraceae bacterium]|nr:alpha/beta fold hydrolase [Bacteroidia bacterium]NNE16222.1 alpha/beta fold hydrolase [Saprospiraceae bacterium]NNL91216.1 alpha/beta fold hydrolase [Saprospiraceae bacterium]